MLFVFRKYPRAQIAPILDLYCKNLHQTLIVLQFLFISLKFSLSPPNGQSSKRESHAICFSQVPAGELSESVPRFKMSMAAKLYFFIFYFSERTTPIPGLSYRSTLAPAPFISASTSSFLAMVVSPGVVMARAP